MMKISVLLTLGFIGNICFAMTQSSNSTTFSDYYGDPYDTDDLSGYYEESGDYVTDDEDYVIPDGNYREIDDSTLFENNEKRRKSVPKKHWFSCDRGELWLTKDKRCDGHPDCQDCSDESDCPGTSNQFFYCYGKENLSSLRNRTEFSSFNPFCIPRHKFCDGEVDCASGSDERQTGIGFKCAVKKRHRTCLLPEEMICDDITDCENGADVCNDVGLNSTSTSNAKFKGTSPPELFQCLSSIDDVTIFQHQVCDGIVDCPDLSDECLCEDAPSENITKLCSDTCWHDIWLERPVSQSCSRCFPGEVMLCNGDQDFSGIEPSGYSEVEHSGDECACVAASSLCANPISSFLRSVCSPTTSEEVKFVECFSGIGGFSSIRARMCDGRPECLFGEDECVPECAAAFNNSGNWSGHFCSLFVAGSTYKCNGQVSSIEASVGRVVHPCDGVIECEDGEDEMYCPTRLSCDSGNDVANTSKSANTFDLNQLCDGKVDCQNGKDENISYCDELKKKMSYDVTMKPSNDRNALQCKRDTFNGSKGMNNKHATTEEEVLKYGLVVLAVTGIIGNFTGIIIAGISSLFIFNKQPGAPFKVMICFLRESVFCLSVALSKMLFSIYLAYTLLSNDSEGLLCVENNILRGAASCQGWGELALISITTPLFALAIFVTIETLSFCQYFIKGRNEKNENFLPAPNENEAQNTRSLLWIASMLVLYVLVWLPSIVVSVLANNLPHEQGVILMNSSANENLVNASHVISLTERVVTMTGNTSLVASPFTWEHTNDVMSTYAPALGYKFVESISFYSYGALCLPLFFARPYDSKHFTSAEQFSFNVMLFISAICVYVCAMCIIHKVASMVTSNSDSESKKRYAGTSKGSLTGYVITEIITWIPILVTYYINLSMGSAHQTVTLLAVAINCGFISLVLLLHSRRAIWSSSCSRDDRDVSNEETNSMINDKST